MKCCICGKQFKGSGNSPWGALNLDNTIIKWNKNDRCCDECNMEIVIPGRVKTYVSRKNNLCK